MQVQRNIILGSFIKSFWAMIVLILPFNLLAQFNTAVQDGVINPGEYGNHVNGQNQQVEGGTTYFMAWDANNLYFAFTGSNFNEAAVLYLDIDPQIPVNGGGTNANGSTQGLNSYDRNQMMLPFRSDFLVYFKNGYSEYRFDDGAGYWGGNFSFILTTGFNAGTNTAEVAIPWNTITNGAGMPAVFNWLGFKVYDYGAATNGVYSATPNGNPNCACNQALSQTYSTRYYNVLSTANGAATPPFSLQSFTYSEDFSTPGTGGYYLNGLSFYDFTVNDNNSTDNTDNDPVNQFYNNGEISNRVLLEGAIGIDHNLYIGQGSAFLPADNTSGAVLATVTMTGNAGSIYNYGRIDPNPEASGAGDWNNRRIDFVFAGNTRLQATNLFKDRWRLSNATINAGATLVGPLSDSLGIELQFGTLQNNGSIDFGDGSAGFADLGLRGDWSQHNDYFLDGAGTWMMHDILIGRNSSRLQPNALGGTVYLQIQGDFENYDEFLGNVGTGLIDVAFAGRKRQYLRGNTTETAAAETHFHNLIIDNANGLSDNNNSADVHFESFGGGTIDYFVTGTLTLREGDLVTRDRVSSTIHNLTMRDSALIVSSGAKSNLGLNGSSFVDGPLRYEIEDANLTSRQCPVGKTKTVSGYALGDYRHLQLEVDHSTASKTTYQVETWLDDRVATYTWPSSTPEVITWVSRQRYWEVQKLGGANVDAAYVTLDYDLSERNDGVINAPALRIVKDDGLGNWANITPLGVGGTANNTGQIRSHAFTSFSDFTLASIDPLQILGVELLDFEAFRRGEVVELDWTTKREFETAEFIVERSLDRLHFEAIGTLEARGDSSNTTKYDFTDTEPDFTEGEIYYRLRIIDRLGDFSYSMIRTVLTDPLAGPKLLIYPNPSQGDITLEWLGPINSADQRALRLTNALGQIVFESEWKAESLLEKLDLSIIPKGIYILEVKGQSGRLFRKLILE